MNEEIKINKSTFYVFAIIFLIVITGYFLIKSNNVTGSIIQEDSNEDFQKVVLGIKDYNYYPNTITVGSGKPVRVYLDSSVSGCLRSFTIPDFGIAKNLPTPNDYVEFTPTKKGTYNFACSMGMGTGKLIVEW